MSEVDSRGATGRSAPGPGSACWSSRCVVSLGAYALAGLGLQGKAPRDLVVYGVDPRSPRSSAGGSSIRSPRRAPTPCCYPTAALLGGLGLAMLYRLIDARGLRRREQAVWLLVGLGRARADAACSSATTGSSTPTRTRSGWSGVVLLLFLPVVPGIGREINGARLWVDVGGSRSSRRSSAKIFIVIFLASYLADEAGAARRRGRDGSGCRG